MITGERTNQYSPRKSVLSHPSSDGQQYSVLMRHLSCLIASAALSLLAVGPRVFAQKEAPADSARAYTMESIVVTADRSAGILAQSTASVSVLRAEEIRQLPGIAGLADVLRHAPGFAMFDLTGQGFDPQATIRGFYGGGEAEYIVVLLNGRPLNNMETGLINWNQIPMSAVTSVEVIRGGASSLYGDAAIGAIVNVVTTGEAPRGAHIGFAGGSFGTILSDVSISSQRNGRALALFGNLLVDGGFRDHGDRGAGSGGLSIDIIPDARHALTVSALAHARSYNTPGPLTRAELAQSRTQKSPLFKFDDTSDATYRVAVNGRIGLSNTVQITGSLAQEYRTATVVRTLPLSAFFADTKRRDLQSTRFFASGQLEATSLLAPDDKLVLGVDAKRGKLNSEYWNYFTGSLDDYLSENAGDLQLSAEGDGKRAAVAAFFQYDLHPLQRLRLTLGGRLDEIGDSYAPASSDRWTAGHSAFSPKLGINVRYAGSERHVGHWYANVARSFKTATMDQLYDQRTIPVPFPPFGITVSNDELKPQRGTSIETGLYHRAELSPGRLAGELTLSVYQMDMTDELDFSFATFRYENIAESRHRGVEAGVKLYVQERATVFANYTLQNVKTQSGDNKGKFVKAIPRDYVSAGLMTALAASVSASVTVRSARRMFLDDANTAPLDNYTTVDAKVSALWRFATLWVEALNLMDATYSTTGFPDPDPSDSDIVFLYPAAGRAFRLGVNVDF